MPDLIGTENIDILPVGVSGRGNSKFLGILKLMSSTGAETVEAVPECLQDLPIKDNTKAICFDTTASNTDLNKERKKSARVTTEAKLCRGLLALLCKHFINKIMD